jgi:hypothetical protein
MHTQWLGVEHAHLLCVLLVCVCTRSCELGFGEDQLGSLIISPPFALFVNLPSGFATWLNSVFGFDLCRDHQLSKMDMEFIIYKIK